MTAGIPRNRFSWKKHRLYYNNKRTLYGLITHLPYNMYYCDTPNGSSLDFYNLSRAKQHVINLYRKDLNVLLTSVPS